MQTKPARTGSMMTLDTEKPYTFENRQHGEDDDYWCMIMPDKGHYPEPGFNIVLGQGKTTIEFLTYYKLNRHEHSELYTHCRARRCVLITLPVGTTPRDLKISSQGR